MKKNLLLSLLSFFLINLTTQAQENCGNTVDDDGDGLIDCLDPDCKSSNVPTGMTFNTASNGAGGVLSGTSADLNWKVSVGSLTGPYAAAIVLSPVPGAYYSSPWSDCAWIGHTSSGYHTGDVDYYYKIEFLLPCYTLCSKPYSDSAEFCLHMDFYCDNSIDEVYINGVTQSGNLSGIPIATPYNNPGFQSCCGYKLSLCNGWKAGLNTLILKVSSSEHYEGFLAQNSTTVPPPVYINPTIANIQPLCDDGPPVTLTAASTGGTWSASCGPCLDSVTGVFNPTLAGTGTYLITYTTNPCTAKDTALLTVYPNPDASINTVPPRCLNTPPFNLTGVTPGGVWSGTGITNSSNGTFNPAVSGPGVFTVTHIILGICTDTATQTVTIYNTPDTTVIGPITICFGDSLLLANGSYATTAGTFYSGLFTTKGCDSIISTNIIISPLVTSSMNVTICFGDTLILPSGSIATASGAYTSVLVSHKGCDSIITTNLNVRPNITSSQSFSICKGDTLILPGGGIALVSGSYTNILISPGTGCDSTITTNLNVIQPLLTNQGATITCIGQYTILPNGDTVYTAGSYIDTLTAVYGCDSIVTTVVTINPSPIASFTANPLVGTPPLVVNFTNTSQNATSYLWLFGDGASSTLTNPSHTYTTPGVYTVTLIASLNPYCPDTTTLKIIVNENYYVFIPNVFTPNDDGTNDGFYVNAEGVKKLHAEIYDRWGLKLYEWYTVKGGWDGYTSSGNKATDGTYYYIITLTEESDKVHVEKGAFTLIR